MPKPTKPKIIINPTTTPLAEKHVSTAPILRSYYWPYFFGAVPVAIFTVFFSIFFYRLLPPQIPLFGGLADVEQILADRIYIFLLPVLAFIIDLIHALVIYFGRKYDTLLLTCFAYFTIGVQVLILAVLLRTVLVVI